MLPKADRIAYVNHYTRGQADPSDPRLSPLRAASLADLPPALVITAEHDLCATRAAGTPNGCGPRAHPPATPTTSE